MYYTVYKITNKINNKIYIGVHKTSDLEDDYMGSGKHLKHSQSKYGIENFNKEIIFRAVSSEIMYWVERMFVDEEFVSSEETYNLKVGGVGGFDYINESGLGLVGNVASQKVQKELHKDEEWLERKKSKISESNRLSYENGRQSILTGQEFKGKKHTEETKQKMSIAQSKKAKGEGNSQFGSIWIYSLTEKVSKKINKDELPVFEEQGWLKGRKMKF